MKFLEMMVSIAQMKMVLNCLSIVGLNCSKELLAYGY